MANEIQKIPAVNETISSAWGQFQNVQPLVYDNSISPYETISKLLWYVKLLVSTTNSIIDSMGQYENDFSDIRNELTTIKNRIGQIETELGNVKTRLDNHDTELININEELEQIHNSINDIASDISDINNNISNIVNRINGHDTAIASIRSDITDINSTLTNLQNQITSNDSDIETINRTIETINGNINTINSTLVNLQSQITSNDTDITTLQGDISTLRSDLTKLQSNVISIQEQVVSNDNDISVLQSRMTAAESDIDKLQLDLSNLETRFTLMQNSINIIQDNIKTINNNINSINDAIGSINSTISTMQTSINTNRTDISNLKTRADNTDTALNQIKQDIAALDIDTIKQELNEINNDITSLNQQVSNLQQQITSNDRDIENLQNQASSLTNSIETLDARLDSVDSDITSIRTLAQQNASNITSLQTDLAKAKSDVANLATRMQQVETEIESLDARVETVEDSITSIEDVLKSKGNVSTSSNMTNARAIVSTGANTIKSTTVTETELGYLSGVTSGIQGQLNSKTSNTGDITSASNLTSARAVVASGNKQIKTTDVTETELGYLSGASSNVQTQLNNKFNKTDVIPIYSGGTGATGSPNAKINLKTTIAIDVGYTLGGTPTESHFNAFKVNALGTWGFTELVMLVEPNGGNTWKSFIVRLAIRRSDTVIDPIQVMPMTYSPDTNLILQKLIITYKSVPTTDFTVWYRAAHQYDSVRIHILSISTRELDEPLMFEDNLFKIELLPNSTTGQAKPDFDVYSDFYTLSKNYSYLVGKANNDFTTDRVIVSDGANTIKSSNVSTTELSYLSGLNSNIQTQLNDINTIVNYDYAGLEKFIQINVPNGTVNREVTLPLNRVFTGYASPSIPTTKGFFYRFNGNMSNIEFDSTREKVLIKGTFVNKTQSDIPTTGSVYTSPIARIVLYGTPGSAYVYAEIRVLSTDEENVTFRLDVTGQNLSSSNPSCYFIFY